MAQQTQFKIPQGHSGACLFSIQFFFFSFFVIFSCCFSGIPRSWKERNRPKDLAFIFLVGFFDFFGNNVSRDMRSVAYCTKISGCLRYRGDTDREVGKERRSRADVGED